MKIIKPIIATLVGLSAIGSIVYVEKGSCIGYDMKIPVNTEFTWCLDNDEYKEAKMLLTKQVKGKEGYDSEMAKALVREDPDYRKEIAGILLAQYEVNGWVDFDNYILHNYILELHFNELKDRDALPLWETNKAELDNKGKLDKIHDSLKTNLK
ncbi:MAG: hypothetical protein KKD44_27740 [Proteobacteria bacterium]|nr:hypothetical protein [Pseudomonadota bacterium]